MRFLSFSTFSTHLLLLFSHTLNATDIISDTCKKAVNPNLKYNFCITSLQADPNSHTADLKTLGIVSIKLSIANVTYVQSTIQKLLNDEQVDPEAKGNLQNCLELYGNAIPDLNDAIGMFKSSDYGDANVKLGDVNEMALDCEDGFKIKGLVSPLAKENDDCFQLTALGQAISNMLSS